MTTTPTTCSTTTTATTASDPSNYFRSSISSYQPLTTMEPGQILLNAKTPNKINPSSPPLSFNLLAVSQGLTVNVALHSTLKAVYHVSLKFTIKYFIH